MFLKMSCTEIQEIRKGVLPGQKGWFWKSKWFSKKRSIRRENHEHRENLVFGRCKSYLRVQN